MMDQPITVKEYSQHELGCGPMPDWNFRASLIDATPLHDLLALFWIFTECPCFICTDDVCVILFTQALQGCQGTSYPTALVGIGEVEGR